MTPAHNPVMGTPPPGKFEFDLLRFLADRQGLSVREMHEEFGKPRGFVRGTIVKSIDRLHKKGFVQREQVAGTFRYRTTRDAEELERDLVEDFIRERLGGRLKPIASFLVDADDIDISEIERFRQMLDQLEP